MAAPEFAGPWGNPLDLFDFASFDAGTLQALEQQRFEITDLEALSSFHGLSPKSDGASATHSGDSPLSMDSMETLMPAGHAMSGGQSDSEDDSDGNDHSADGAGGTANGSRRRVGRMDPETRRQSRVVREKRRQQNISNGYDEIKALVPGCSDYKISRATILQRCAAYLVQVRKTMARMQKDSEALRLENAQLAAENAQLRALLDESAYGQAAAGGVLRGVPEGAGATATSTTTAARPVPEGKTRTAPAVPIPRVRKNSRVAKTETIELGLPAIPRRPTSYADQQVLMLLCAFFLIFPTVGLFNPDETTHMPHATASTTARQLQSFGTITDAAGGLFRSRVALHMLLCFRSLAVMVIARIVLLTMDPAISAGAEALERASKFRRKGDVAFRLEQHAEAKQHYLRALSELGHSRPDPHGWAVQFHTIAQVGHHKLRWWRLGRWVDSAFHVIARTVSTCDFATTYWELARIYHGLHIIECMYDGLGVAAVYSSFRAINYAESAESTDRPGNPLLSEICCSVAFVLDRLFPQFQYLPRVYTHMAQRRAKMYGMAHVIACRGTLARQRREGHKCRIPTLPGLLLMLVMLVACTLCQMTTYAFSSITYRDNTMLHTLMIFPSILFFPLAVLATAP